MMASITQRTNWYDASPSASIHDLVTHLHAMGATADGIGESNAAAAIAAAELIEEWASELGIEIEQAELNADEYRRAADDDWGAQVRIVENAGQGFRPRPNVGGV